MHVFLDANILFSAAKSAGAVRELLTRLLARGHVLCADQYVITEARRNLELTESMTGGRQGSLLATIDLTMTGAGARLLARHLAAPLTDGRMIERRLDMVQFFREDDRTREDVRAHLKRCPDLERALMRRA